MKAVTKARRQIFVLCVLCGLGCYKMLARVVNGAIEDHYLVLADTSSTGQQLGDFGELAERGM